MSYISRAVVSSLSALSAILLPLSSFAQTPALINYQGRVLNGTNLVNGNVGLSLRLFNVSSGGTKLYEDSNTVTVADGLYSTFIGDHPTNSAFLSALTNTAVWVEVAVNGTTLAPREPLASVGYSLATRGLLVTTNGSIVLNPDLGTNSIAPSSAHAGIAGGLRNVIGTNSHGSFIGGGFNNSVLAGAQAVAIGGGTENNIGSSASYSTIGGGNGNRLADNGTYAAIVGGRDNSIGTNSSSSSIGGGYGNGVAGNSSYATIAGGYLNGIGTNANYTTIGGGFNNEVADNNRYATIAGGLTNRIGADAPRSAIGGGEGNSISNGTWLAVIAGGRANKVGTNAFGAAIGGGLDNRVADNSQVAVIAGGGYNGIGTNAFYAVVAGGYVNVIQDNSPYAAIPGGRDNAVGAGATNAFAAGRRAKANHRGTFVWADDTNADFASTTNNQFLIRAGGGVGIGTTVTTGAALTVAGSARFTGEVVAASFTGNGAALTGLGGTQLADGTVSNADLAAGSVNATTVQDGTLTGADIANGSISNADVAANTFWNTTGNAGTVPGTHFLGTTDSKPVEVRANNLRAVLIQPSNGAPNFVLGAAQNDIAGGTWGASILGGSNNTIGTASVHALIAGGRNNRIGTNALSVVIGGGQDNDVADNSFFATIAGGSQNDIGTNSDSAAIGGGRNNNVAGDSSGAIIHGGRLNFIGNDSDYTAIGGGFSHNVASNSQHATIAGGRQNTIGSGSHNAAIGGGDNNQISADSAYSVIPGGRDNLVGVGASNAFAAGRQAHANHRGAFVWADDTSANFASTASNQFLVRAGGGVGINTTEPEGPLHVSSGSAAAMAFGGSIGIFESGGDGYVSLLVPTNQTGGYIFGTAANNMDAGVIYNGSATRDLRLRVAGSPRMTITTNGNVGIGTTTPTGLLHVAGNAYAAAWLTTSDRNAKQDIAPVDAAAILEKISALPVASWSFKTEPDVKHIGPMAQDFRAAFGLGPNDTTIATVDADGVALAAIQALHDEVRRLKEEGTRLRDEATAWHGKQKAENEGLKKQLEELAQRLRALEAK